MTAKMILGVICHGKDGKTSFGMEVPEGTNPAYADSFARYLFSLGSCPLCDRRRSIEECQPFCQQKKTLDEVLKK